MQPNVEPQLIGIHQSRPRIKANHPVFFFLGGGTGDGNRFRGPRIECRSPVPRTSRRLFCGEIIEAACCFQLRTWEGGRGGSGRFAEIYSYSTQTANFRVFTLQCVIGSIWFPPSYETHTKASGFLTPFVLAMLVDSSRLRRCVEDIGEVELEMSGVS